MKTTFLQQYFCPDNNKYSIIIEDDGLVAYAYLLKEKKIISDVWLYNQATTPTEKPWLLSKNMPFLNSKEFVIENKMIKPITNDEDINILWTYNRDLECANIHINSVLIAVLKPNYRPGFSSLVYKDSPLAKKL